MLSKPAGYGRGGRRRPAWIGVASACAVWWGLGETQAAPPPPASVVAADRPNDAGTVLDVSWRPAADPAAIDHYAVAFRTIDGGAFQQAVDAAPTATTAAVENLDAGTPYVVRVVAVGLDGTASPPAFSAPAVPVVQWFNLRRAWLASLLTLVCGAVLGFIAAARRGRNLWVRPIAGLSAVADAVGRAVEMGKGVMFVPGVQDINDMQTVAGMTVLSRVARIAAEYDAQIAVPTARSLVMATARETVAASYLQAGRPDGYNADDVYYLTDEQFGYVAGVTGQMVREKPAACFYMGAFFAESLILAETGNGIGAIQIAGTAQPSQLPFFIAACDYALIGEEFFAASAYLSGEPQQLGSLKGQDFGKVVCGLLIVVGVLLATFLAATAGSKQAWEQQAWEQQAGGAAAAFRYLKGNVLGDAGPTPEPARELH